MAIRSIRHRGLKRLFEDDSTRGVDARQADKLRKLLEALNNASVIDDVGLMPGWRLHQLSGDLQNYWSLSVTGNRRLIFEFEDGDAFNLDLVDYH